MQAHADFLGEPGGYVDPIRALDAAGVLVQGMELGGRQSKTFGIYFGPEDSGPAVLLNTRFDETAVRHTAAHELGHHVFGHGTQADDHIDSLEELGRRSWPMHEMAAEAFAAWFLMHPDCVATAMAGLGIAKVASPEQVYQLSLWLGTSFRGTVRHLANLRRLSQRQAQAWIAASPARLRRTLDADSVSPRHWQLGLAASGHRLHVRPGDLLTVDLAGEDVEHTVLPDGIQALPADGTLTPTLRLQVNRLLQEPSTLTASDDWHVALVPCPERRGHLNPTL
ncbi:ImmA/IrrE family metallo-endopeptidase [Catenulispora subtropica]|uniref:ImmA/IrrE family metallo-endopeptidase n=1 Tax=Catenulispora subtropica TaxID=450798 RepID=UPI0031DDFE21